MLKQKLVEELVNEINYEPHYEYTEKVSYSSKVTQHSDNGCTFVGFAGIKSNALGEKNDDAAMAMYKEGA